MKNIIIVPQDKCWNTVTALSKDKKRQSITCNRWLYSKTISCSSASSWMSVLSKWLNTFSTSNVWTDRCSGQWGRGLSNRALFSWSWTSQWVRFVIDVETEVSSIVNGLHWWCTCLVLSSLSRHFATQASIRFLVAEAAMCHLLTTEFYQLQESPPILRLVHLWTVNFSKKLTADMNLAILRIGQKTTCIVQWTEYHEQKQLFFDW